MLLEKKSEATWFLTKMSCYLMEFIMPLLLTRAPGPLAEKPPPYLTVGMRCRSLSASFS